MKCQSKLKSVTFNEIIEGDVFRFACKENSNDFYMKTVGGGIVHLYTGTLTISEACNPNWSIVVIHGHFIEE